MYLVGAAHPHKGDARRRLEELISQRTRLVTDAEVFQELLHRYSAIGRRDAINPAFEVLNSIVDDVFPIERADVDGARGALFESPALSSRDALHVAVMRRRRVHTILSFDSGFDAVSGIERLGA